MSSAVEIARVAWGADLPDWVLRLAQERDRTSQNRVAGRIGYSSAAVSNVIANKYNAPTGMIEERVRGVLMAQVMDCPALGEMPVHMCREWRKKSRKFASGNRQRVMMFRACMRCPVNKLKED